MSKEIIKTSEGYATQRWDAKTGKFLGQKFTCQGECTYEDENGKSMDDTHGAPGYEPYEMISHQTKLLCRDLFTIVLGDNDLLENFMLATNSSKEELEDVLRDLEK